jgi:signal transduction histidine kinase/DNA-binding response OmpR family regulator
MRLERRPIVAAIQDATYSENDLRVELEHLRRSLLPMFLLLVFFMGWAWFCWMMFNDWALGPNVLPTMVLFLTAAFAFALRTKHHSGACWLVILGAVAAFALIATAHPFSNAMAFGVLIIVAASALLGTREATLVALLTWLLGSLARAHGLGVSSPLWHAVDMLVLYVFALGTVWLARRPLRASIECAYSGWAQAKEALVETRARRAEVYRALRALEEATFRIERMNEELVVARREAEVARAAKARLAATVSHELRGPLNLVLGFSRMMVLSPEKYGEPLPGAYHADVDALYRNSQHLVALVDDILDLSQIEAERLPLVKDQVDLVQDVISKAVEIMAPLAERKGLYLRHESTGVLDWILADAVRLRQVLLNLLNNALRFTDKGGVTIYAEQRDNRVWVRVADTGAGISPQDLPRIFEAFHQTHTTRKREQRGSGLGLSICKQLIELHGGEIWVESNPGTGTVFSFTLPRPGAEPLHTTVVKTAETSRQPEGYPNCLVVNVDPDMVRFLARNTEGYRVIGLSDVAEVLSMVEECHPRAIIAPLELLPGIEQQLDASSFDVPMIGCHLPPLTALKKMTGVVGYLVKPVAPEALVALMKQVERVGQTQVLLVDDDPDAVRLLEMMLTSLPHGVHVSRAYDGQQALACMENMTPDVVLLDLIMPGMDGQQLMARMRADERLKEVPVIVVSAMDWFESKITLGNSMTMRCRENMPLAVASRCLRGLLDAATPQYLPEPAPLAPSEAVLAH